MLPKESGRRAGSAAMASKTSYVRIAAFAAVTVGVLLVMHVRRTPQSGPAATQQEGAVASDQPLSANWPLGVYSDNKEWLTFHELMVKELRNSEKEQARALNSHHTPQDTMLASATDMIRLRRASSLYSTATASQSSGGAPYTATRATGLAAQRVRTSSGDTSASGAAQPSLSAVRHRRALSFCRIPVF